MNIAFLSKLYDVRKIVVEDIPDVLNLCEGNPLYYKHCPPPVSQEQIKADLVALPPNKSLKDKYYIGFYNKDQLVALMDLIVEYPDKDTVFIGFFMVNNKLQGTGIGTRIIKECLEYLKSIGYKQARLGYVKDNPQARAFWEKNNFKPTGVEVKQDHYIVVIMENTMYKVP